MQCNADIYHADIHHSAFFRKQVIQHISLKKLMLHLEIRDSRSLHYRREKGAIGTT
jgi:hypothetical protein